MKLLLALMVALVSLSSFASDNLVTDGKSGSVTLIDNAGNRWDASISYTTDGLGDIFTLGGLLASSDNIIGTNPSSNRTLIDSLGRWWRASVQYTTDGNGNVIPIPAGTSGGSAAWGAIGGTLSNQTDLQSALNAKQDVLGFTPENAANDAADAKAAAKSGTSAQQFYVSKDAGNDANDCSILKPCKTIQAGVTAANAVGAFYSQAIVYVSPSTGTASYSENVTLSQQGVNLQCANPVQNTRACVINGTISVNLTGTSGGAAYNAASNYAFINGFVVTGGASSALTFSGTTFQRLVVVNSYIQSSSASALVASNDASLGGVKSTLVAYDTTYENNSSSNPNIEQTGGRVWNYGTQPTITNDNAAGHSLDQSGTTSFVANLAALTGEVNITDNTASATFNLSTISSGSNPCIATPASPNTGIITIAYFGCTSTATNSVTGAGVIFTTPGNVRLSTSGDIISTVTQAVVPGLPQGEVMLGAGAATGTNVLLSLKGGHIKVAQTTAPTATVSANAGTGATCTVSNAVDSAGKISLTTTSTAPAAGAQCTVTFNKAYGVAPVCQLTPTNSNSILFAVANGIFLTTTTTTAVINYANADAVGHADTWSYYCVETQ